MAGPPSRGWRATAESYLKGRGFETIDVWKKEAGSKLLEGKLNVVLKNKSVKVWIVAE